MKYNFLITWIIFFRLFWRVSARFPITREYKIARLNGEGEEFADDRVDEHAVEASYRFEDVSITLDERAAVMEYFRVNGPRMLQDWAENNRPALERFFGGIMDLGFAYQTSINESDGNTHLRISLYRLGNLLSTSQISSRRSTENFNQRTYQRSDRRGLSLTIGAIGFDMNPEERTHYQGKVYELLNHFRTNDNYGIQNCFVEMARAGYSIFKFVKILPDLDEIKIFLTRRRSDDTVDELETAGIFEMIDEETKFIIPGYKLTILFHPFHLGFSEAEINRISTYFRVAIQRLLNLIRQRDLAGTGLFYADISRQGLEYVVVIENCGNETTIHHYLYKVGDAPLTEGIFSNQISD